MTSLRRLLSCLCALALVAGMPGQARAAWVQEAMAQAHGSATATVAPAPAGDPPGECHPRDTETVAGTTDADHDHASDEAAPMECCDDMPGNHGCESACSCPAAAPALAVAPMESGTPAILHATWTPPGYVGRSGPAHGPPTPPPRG